MNRTPSDKSSSSETKETKTFNEYNDETLPSTTENELSNEGDPSIGERELTDEVAPSIGEGELTSEGDPSKGEGELVITNLKDEPFVEADKAKSLDCVLSMNEISSKGGDTIIDVLTEKHLDSTIEHRQKTFWLYFMETTSAPAGDILDYDEGDRNDFVRLVFLLTSSMLAITFSFIFMVNQVAPMNKFMHTHTAMYISIFCILVLIAVSYAFACSDCSRREPTNWIVLILGTLSTTFICGAICAHYEPYIILCAAGSTLLVSIFCLGLAFTSIDFTKFLIIVLVGLIALSFASFFLSMMSFAFNIKFTTLKIAILIGSTVLSSVMLVIELQMILGGKSVELGEDDYCFAAFLVYTSIIDIFIKFLRIYSEINN